MLRILRPQWVFSVIAAHLGSLGAILGISITFYLAVPGSNLTDITIISLASQASQNATLPLAATKDDSMIERTAKLVAKHLGAVVERHGAGIHIQTDHQGPRAITWRFDGDGS